MVIGAARPVILIVEDDLRVRTLLKRLLEIEDNYTVELAANGTEGLTRVEAGGISPVLLDLMLPGMGGLELCRRVCALEREPYWPIIMVPGLDTEVDRHAGFEAGANDYIVKPFLATELRDRVQVWLRTRQFLEAAGERQQRSAHPMPDVGPDSALALACATNHELTRLLSLLLMLAELWDAGYYSPEDVARIRMELRTSAEDLATRFNILNEAARQAQQWLNGPATSST